jgi:RNA recognition motif-containing protein
VNCEIDSAALHDVFKDCEGFESAKVFTDANGKSTGTGVIVFQNEVSAQQFLRDYDGVELDNQPLKLELTSVSP